MNKPPMLRDWIGRNIILSSGVFGPKGHETVKLTGIEPAAGIWIEYQQMVNEIMTEQKLQDLEESPVIFIPFANVRSIVVTQDFPALNESAFGLDKDS